MKRIMLLILLFIFSVNGAQTQEVQVPETQEAYKKRMQWFVEAKYGMFIHFGLYSQLGGIWEGKEIPYLGEWIQSAADIQSQEYAMLTHSFYPSDFDADKIAKIASDAGMKYIVITAKHHEGFCLWDSEYTNFDVGSTPFKGRDILAELNSACKKYGLKFCIYYSILDWHHPSQIQNCNGINKDAIWGQIAMRPGHKDEYLTYLRNQIKELMEKYEPKLLWFDGSWPFWWTLEDGKDLNKLV